MYKESLNIRSYFVVLAKQISKFLSKNYYVTEISRMVVRYHDNDGNADMEENGELGFISLVISNSKSSDIFFDIGANIGEWSSAVLNLGFKGRIFAIDPIENNLNSINCRLNKDGFTNFSLYKAAVSDEPGNVNFYVNENEALSGHDSLMDMRTIGYHDSVKAISVNAERLTEIAEKLGVKHISFLKVDVEGNEFSVLKSAESLLEAGKIDFIQIEYGHAARAARTYLHDIIFYIEKFNYNVFIIKPNCIEPLIFTPFIENRYSYINLILIKSNLCNAGWIRSYIKSR